MKFIKCTDASGAYEYLVEDRVYRVADETNECYMLDEHTNYWNKARFEVVEDLDE